MFMFDYKAWLHCVYSLAISHSICAAYLPSIGLYWCENPLCGALRRRRIQKRAYHLNEVAAPRLAIAMELKNRERDKHCGAADLLYLVLYALEIQVFDDHCYAFIPVY